MTRRLAALALATTVLSLGAGPALAASGSVTDPAGDATRGLDVTRATLTNGQRTLTATVTVARLRAGALIVSVDRRNGAGLRLVTDYRPGGRTESYVLPGAFTDERSAAARCPGFRVTWDRKARTAMMTLPSRCLAQGRYGDVRFAVLTEEAGGGADSDVAPETRDGDIGTSRWIPRG